MIQPNSKSAENHEPIRYIKMDSHTLHAFPKQGAVLTLAFSVHPSNQTFIKKSFSVREESKI